MKQTRTLDFESGLDYVVNTIIETRNCPYIVNVIGLPNSGTDEFRRGIVDRLDKIGVHGWSGRTDDSIEKIAQPLVEPEFILLEDVSDPIVSDRYSQDLFLKKPDFRVYMMNSIFQVTVDVLRDICLGQYDLVVENRNREKKGERK